MGNTYEEKLLKEVEALKHEFKAMVKDLHKTDIGKEFNHAESFNTFLLIQLANLRLKNK